MVKIYIGINSITILETNYVKGGFYEHIPKIFYASFKQNNLPQYELKSFSN